MIWKSGTIIAVVWTKNSEPIEKVPIPTDKDRNPANDLRFRTNKLIIDCYWTKDGEFFKEWKLPKEKEVNRLKLVVR